MADTKVTLSGWELDNPVIPASGTFGYGKEFAQCYDINCLGTFSFKGTTRLPRFGNPPPPRAAAPAGRGPAAGGAPAGPRPTALESRISRMEERKWWTL